MSKRKKTAAPVGVVDIGSNSVRLVVYDLSAAKPKMTMQAKANCGLAKGMRHDHRRLNPDGVKKALRTLRRFRALLDKHQVEKVAAIGTAAMRQTRHTPQGRKFHAQAERALGHKISVVSGPREARLGAQGVTNSWPKANGICGDFGGGSLELTRVVNGENRQAVSLPLGSLTLLTETGGDRQAAAALIRRRLRRLSWLQDNGETFYTIGGSWRTLAHVLRGHGKAQPMHGHKLAAPKARPKLKKLAAAPVARFSKMGKKIRHRASMLPVAALVLSELMDIIQPQRIVFSGHGVREGIVAEMKHQRKAP